MPDLIEYQKRCADEFGRRVTAIRDDQWSRPTPCTDWDVRMLVNHVVSEDRWAPHLAKGETIEEVGDRYEGDQLGDDPKAAWNDAAAGAAAAFQAPGVLERTVHLSFGDLAGAEYLSQLICDHLIHAWDLARGIGDDDTLDPEIVGWVWEIVQPQEPMLRASGMFGERVAVADNADTQTKLLALLGRRR